MLLFGHTLKAPLSCSSPAPTDVLKVSLTLENLNGKNNKFEDIVSFSKAILKPAAQNSHSDGPHARATSSMGNAEGLVKI